MKRSAVTITATILQDVRRVSGETTPVVRAVRRKYSRLLAAEPSDRVLAIVKVLLAERTWAARVVAYELVAGHEASMAQLNSRLVEQMATGLSDWGSVDLFGVTVAGAVWRRGGITDAHVRRWARSKDRWRRRLALVSTVPLNSKARGGSGDVIRTLGICRALVADREDMVVKALSWALRELSKREPESVAEFLREQETSLAPRVRREVRTRLETGRKVQSRTSRQLC